MREERIAGTLTYTGTAEEIVALLRGHADLRDGSADFFSAADMRRGADEIEKSLCLEYKLSAVYRVEDADSAQAEGDGELVDTRGNP
ncbi:hypothetical protein KGQ19_15925 [Catenulispora sp. NL8]|uniref:Uncharacterized protein n=1 Tax=Catenulispora pinistramenti TaxID=2705254 RepID=A0ABS5KQN3_9ACTN|nr:hypothetical protein [Catenulispora pinistramenti]MBS2548354.1 hypothetical protein [Catenulispora pinistramenti]